jgi:hypothetical protein
MKICLLLQRKFAWVGHAIATELKEKDPATTFCAYVQSRKAEHFLRGRSDLAYTSLLVDEDVHARYTNEQLDREYLSLLEKEYGEPTLWKYLLIDRTVMMRIPPQEYTFSPAPLYSHEEMLRLLQVKFKAIIDFLEKEKPDVLLCSVVAGMGPRILYHVAKKMGMKTYTIEHTRTRNLVTLSENYLGMTRVEKAFEELRRKKRASSKRKEAVTLLREFREKHATYAPLLASYDALAKFKFLHPSRILASIGWLVRLTFEHVRGLHKDDYAEEHPWGLLKSRVRRKLRGLRGFSDLYDTPDWNEDFAYYQLHYEPEMATLLYAPFWTNQIEVIRHISKSLPVHFKLYVREHRGMVNFRPRAFYEELKKMPSVKLLSPETELFDIVEKAKLVTVITSTIGWEATLMGKPVITFGDVYFNRLSMVEKCAEVEKLPLLVKKQLENFRYDEEEMLDYLSAILEESVPVDYARIWEREIDFERIRNDDGLKRLVEFVHKNIARLGVKT